MKGEPGGGKRRKERAVGERGRTSFVLFADGRTDGRTDGHLFVVETKTTRSARPLRACLCGL